MIPAVGGFGRVALVGDLLFVVGLDEDRAGQPQQRGRVREDPDDVGAAFDFFVEPFHQPALGARSTRYGGGSSVEALDVVGESVRHTVVAGSLVGPAAIVSIGLEGLNIGELIGEWHPGIRVRVM